MQIATALVCAFGATLLLILTAKINTSGFNTFLSKELSPAVAVALVWISAATFMGGAA